MNKIEINIPEGFEIDLGGLCKEYAADRIATLLSATTDRSLLVNLGGDIAAAGSHEWVVGIHSNLDSGIIFDTQVFPFHIVTRCFSDLDFLDRICNEVIWIAFQTSFGVQFNITVDRGGEYIWLALFGCESFK
jgi:hypothetical protein